MNWKVLCKLCQQFNQPGFHYLFWNDKYAFEICYLFVKILISFPSNASFRSVKGVTAVSWKIEAIPNVETSFPALTMSEILTNNSRALCFDSEIALKPWATSSLTIVFIMRYVSTSTPLSTDDFAPEDLGYQKYSGHFSFHFCWPRSMFQHSVLHLLNIASCF
jgi:hypothetical protein